MTRSAKDIETCPLGELPLSGPWTACPQCGGKYHQSCWDQNGGCGNFGCASTGETAAVSANVDGITKEQPPVLSPTSNTDAVPITTVGKNAKPDILEPLKSPTAPAPRSPVRGPKFLAPVVVAAVVVVVLLLVLVGRAVSPPDVFDAKKADDQIKPGPIKPSG